MTNWQIETQRPMTSRSPRHSSCSSRIEGRVSVGGGDGLAGDGPSHRRDSVGSSVALLLLGAPIVYAIIGALAALVASPTLPPGECAGIGFGCSFSPRDAIGLAALVGAPFVIVGTYLIGAVALIVARRTWKIGAVVFLLVVEALVVGVCAGFILVAA